MHNFETAISHYKLNISNLAYIEELKLHLGSQHPQEFLRKKLFELDPSCLKLPASRFSLLYWRIRGYDEAGSRDRISGEQGKNGSFAVKKKKLIDITPLYVCARVTHLNLTPISSS